MSSESDIRVPPRALSAAKQGGAERPGVAGSPAGAEEVHSLPTHRVQKTIDTKEPPHEVIVWGLFAVHDRDGNLPRIGGVVRSDIRVPEAKRGRVPL